MYTSTQNSSGTYDIFKDGMKVSTGTKDYADSLATSNQNSNPQVGIPTPPTTITSDNLKPATPLQFPQTIPDTTDYNAIITSLPNYTDIINQYNNPTPLQTDRTQQKSNLTSLMERLTGKSTDQAQIETQYKIPEYTQQLTDLNNQLTTLQNEAKAIPLKVQNQFSGTGATQGGVAPIQSAQLRENAIKSLEISSLASALQNNLSTAQSLADRAIKLKYDTIERQIANQEKLLELNYQDFTADEKKRADILQVQLNARKEAVAQEKENRQVIMGWSAEAAKLGNAPALVLQQALAQTNPQEALRMLSPYLSDPNAKAQALADLEYKRAQTASANATTANTYANMAKTRAETAALGGTPAKTSKEISLVNDINNLVADPNFDSVFGVKGLVSTLVPGSASQKAKANIQNVIDQLALAARGQLKGQGQISDFEGKMLKSAQTALNFRMSPDQARQELAKIRGAITTSSGGEAMVKITNSKGESKIGLADQATITNAINSGYRVEYQ